MNEKIRNEVVLNNYSFWLNCDSLTLINRIKKNKKRPIALNLSNDKLEELIIKRSKIYSRAKIKIDCHKLTKTEAVNQIIKFYEKN